MLGARCHVCKAEVIAVTYSPRQRHDPAKIVCQRCRMARVKAEKILVSEAKKGRPAKWGER